MESRTGRTVGIDAGPLLGEGGISGYVTPLVHALVARDRRASYRLVLRRGWASADGAERLARLAPTARTRVPDSILSWWWRWTGRTFPLGRRLWTGLDCFLATCLVAPVAGRAAVVSLVYDLIPLRLPALFPHHDRFRARMEDVLTRSALLVAISEHTKRDLMDLFGVSERRVRVVYPGRHDGCRPRDEPALRPTLARYGLDDPYLLYVGAHGPHKNVPMLLHAYARARADRGLTARLVLVVRAGLPEVRRLVEQLAVRHDVLCLADVPGEDLRMLYAGARCTLAPSRYEGFGLPVLEALSCGTPVIVSRAGALPEAAGDAGYYVHPDDADGWTEAMCRMTDDARLRERCRAAGLAHASRFSWDRSAQQLGAILTEAAEQVGHA